MKSIESAFEKIEKEIDTQAIESSSSKIQRSLMISGALLERLEDFCSKTNMRKGSVLRCAIRKFIEEKNQNGAIE